MNEYLVGVYKEVGKNPDIIKIKNQKEYLEKLLDGEYTNQDYDDYTILYKKNSDNLLANIYVDQYSKIGVSLKGKVFAVGKDEKGNLKSLNKEQAKKCITFFLRESFDYKNFDEHGRYIPRSKKKNRNIFKNKNTPSTEIDKSKEETKQVQEKAVPQEQPQPQKVNINDMTKVLNIGNNFFESQFRIEKVESNKQENNTSNSSENENSDKNKQTSINNSPIPIIKLSDEQTLNMILKVVFIILDFVRNALEDSESDE